MTYRIKNLSRKLMLLALLSLLCASPLGQLAQAASAPLMASPNGLSFAEIKVTGDEFIMIKNNATTSVTDLSQYWLQDFNNVSPLASGVSNSSQQLPPVSLDAGQSLLLSSASRDTCGAEVAGKLSVSLTDVGGFLEIVQMGQASNGTVTQTPGDVVSWSTTASGQIQSIPSSTKDPQAAYYRYSTASGTYAWQAADVAASNSCQLSVISGSGTTATTTPVSTGSLISAPDSAPVTIIDVTADNPTASSTASLPASDIGLIAPEITEILPNPSGTGNDASDEFIELYNPNLTAFDLSGFSLQSGIASLHSYQFPAGSGIGPASFVAFYSSGTNLSLSNGGGQVKLLDPFGNSIAQTDAYSTAADGDSWSLAAGKWYWSTSPTPGAANIIKQPLATKKTAKSAAAKSKITTTKAGTGAKTPKKALVSNTGSTSSTTAPATPIHPWILALVAVLALLYAIYEYRADLANYGFRFKRYLAARRAAR